MHKRDLNTLKVLSKIVIHTCCADCFLNSINYLRKKGHINEESIVISLFYNPNIHPRSEFVERLKAVKKVVHSNIELVIPDYKPKEYFNMIGKAKEKERRCKVCWDLRIKYLFDYAKENDVNFVTTTLLTSHYQDREVILEIGKKYEKKYNIKFVEIGKEEFMRNVGFYKQNYCGCCFSLVEKFSV